MSEPPLDLEPWQETFPVRYRLPVNPKDRRSLVRRERRTIRQLLVALRCRSPRLDLRYHPARWR
jgi:hypothetical protein